MKKYLPSIVSAMMTLIILLRPSLTVLSQKPFFKFKNISTEQGLSINNATCLLQDRKGFIWVGTRDGLNKYDGYKFTIYRNDPENPSSIYGNYIWSLTEDREGDIWIGTIEGGLNKYEWRTDKFVHYTHDPRHPDGINGNTVQSVLEDSHGNLWAGTTNGLDLLDRKTNKFAHFLHNLKNPGSLADNTVCKLYEDRAGNMWVGTRHGGLDLFEPKKNTFRHFRHDAGNAGSISENSVLSIYEDRAGNLWVGTDAQGLNLFHRETNSFTRFQHDPADPNSVSNNTIRCINEDDRGLLWLGTENGGIDIYDTLHKIFYTYKQDDKDPLGINSNSIWDIYRDRAGNMWLCTFGGGVEFLDREPEKFACFKKQPNNPNSLSNNYVNTFWEDDKGLIWIGTDGGGISVLDRTNNSFRQYRSGSPPNSLTSDVILSIKQGRDKEFLIGTFRGGLNILKDPASGQFTRVPVDTTGRLGTSSDMIGCLTGDTSGNWWLGAWQGGLDYYDKRNNTFTHYRQDAGNPSGISNPSVQCVLPGRGSDLWVGTQGGGLDLLNRATGHFTHYKHDERNPRSLSNDIVNYLLEDWQGRLWIGTSNGLNLFDEATLSFSKYFLKDGLPNNVIQSMLEDKRGNLWIGTNKGISQFDPVAGSFRNYEYNDGLQGTVFNRGACLKTANGDMFFGGSGGFNIFNPDSMRIDSSVPPVFITDLQIFNVPVKVGVPGSPLSSSITESGTLTLSYKQSVFSFEFAALNYSLREKTHYAFKMEGFDKDWNMVGTQRKATYTNLDPGEYVFHVKASNNDGVWNERGASIKITITPPFWATWWFRLLIIILLAAGMVLFYRIRMNAVKTEKKELEQRVIELDKAVAQGKFEIASDVLHDIGNAMVGFGSYLTRIRKLQEQETPEALGKLADFFESERPAMATAIGDAKAAAVIGMLRGLGETQQASQEETGKSVSEQFNIINRIQEILHIQRQYISGKESQERKPVDLRNIVKDCISMLSSSFAGGGITVSTEFAPDLPLIRGDRTKLMQVLLHVMKNSIEAFDKDVREKNIRITIRANADTLTLTIRDTGHGFDESVSCSLFGKGFTTRPAAAGLGLYNCLDIMESHEGTITIRSDGPGTGAMTSMLFKIL